MILIIFAPGQVSTTFFSITAAKMEGPRMFRKPNRRYLRVDYQINNADHRSPGSSVSLILLNS